mgnify:CR=1 FL=1
MKKILCLALITFLFLPVVFGQEEEILKLKEKIIALQNRGELGFRNFTFCSNILGFASYVPLPQPVIDKKGQLLVYYEPLNVYTSKREGLYEMWYTQDMALLKADGETLSEWKDILDFHYTTKSPVMDLFAQNSITLDGKVSPGKYKFKAVLKDKLSGKLATKIVDFEIR